MDASEPHKTDHDPALLIEERRGAACILTLNRPSARNSLSLDLIAALNDAIGRAGRDARCRRHHHHGGSTLPFARGMIFRN